MILMYLLAQLAIWSYSLLIPCLLNKQYCMYLSEGKEMHRNSSHYIKQLEEQEEVKLPWLVLSSS